MGTYLLGTIEIKAFLAAFVFALVGLVISLLFDATTRNPVDLKSPLSFSLSYLLRDNWKRIILVVLLIIVSIRFSEEIFHLKINMFVALLIGCGHDQLALQLKKKTDILKVISNHSKN